jgi:DNA-binding response OmpR family regulator
MKVLIIEDDPASIEIISLIFKVSRPDIEMISSKLGEEGINLVEKEHPDVIVLDLGLPDIDGFEVLRRIRLFSDFLFLYTDRKGGREDCRQGIRVGAKITL